MLYSCLLSGQTKVLTCPVKDEWLDTLFELMRVCLTHHVQMEVTLHRETHTHIIITTVFNDVCSYRLRCVRILRYRVLGEYISPSRPAPGHTVHPAVEICHTWEQGADWEQGTDYCTYYSGEIRGHFNRESVPLRCK